MLQKYILTPLVLSFLIMPSLAFAEVVPLWQAQSAPGLSSCLALFPIGRVTVLLESTAREVAPGGKLEISGVVHNEGALPIVGGVLYVKVYRIISAANPSDEAVDFFQVAKNMNIGKGQSASISFSYHIPADMASGRYRIASVVTPGLGFDPEGVLVIGNPASQGIFDFMVSGNETGAITLVSGSATSNATSSNSGAPATFSATVKNTTGKDVTGIVKWSLYSWDLPNPAMPLSASSSSFRVAAGGSTTVSYTLTDTAHTLYEVVGEIDTPQGTKSIAGFPLSRLASSGAHISYVAASHAPFTAGEDAAFACIAGHGVTLPTVQLILSVTPSGILSLVGPIASASYNGLAPAVPGALIAKASGSASSFIVTAKLYQNGQLLETVSVPYQCGAGIPCNYTPEIALFVALVIIVALIYFIYASYRRRKNHLAP